MSISYSAGVFFGCAVRRDTKLGKRLDRYIDKAGGTPAATSVQGFEIDVADRRQELLDRMPPPVRLHEEGRRRTVALVPPERPRTTGSLDRDPVLAIAPRRPDLAIGWHFQGSAR